jgi:hypothetical protein
MIVDTGVSFLKINNIDTKIGLAIQSINILFNNQAIIVGSLADCFYIDENIEINDLDLVLTEQIFLESLSLVQKPTLLEKDDFYFKLLNNIAFSSICYQGYYKSKKYLKLDCFLDSDNYKLNKIESIKYQKILDTCTIFKSSIKSTSNIIEYKVIDPYLRIESLKNLLNADTSCVKNSLGLKWLLEKKQKSLDKLIRYHHIYGK